MYTVSYIETFTELVCTTAVVNFIFVTPAMDTMYHKRDSYPFPVYQLATIYDN